MTSVIAEQTNTRRPMRTIRFANETGIHGLQPFLSSKHKRERAIWLVVLLLAACCMLRGVVANVIQYLNQPTVTRLFVVAPDEFPDLMICDPFWASEVNLIKMGMTAEEYEALGLVYMYETAFTAPKGNHTLSLASIRSKFGHMAVDDLVRKVSFAANEVIPNVKTFQGWGVGVSTSVGLTATGVCMILKNTLPVKYIFTQIPYDIRFNITHRPPAFGRSCTDRMAPLLAVGEGVYSVYPESSTVIPLSSRVEVLVGMLKVKTTPKTRYDRNCAYWSREAEKHCGHVQFNNVCAEKKLKRFYVPNQNLTLNEVEDLNKLCFVYLDAINGAIMNNCPRPCLRWLYDISTTVAAYTNTNSSWLRVAWRNPADTLFIEEVNSMSFDEFLSHLGGQLSLWSGASLLTLIHVLLFFVCSYNNKA